MYMVAKKWRGAINIESIRYVSESRAAERYHELKHPDTWHLKDWWHMWKVYPDKPPERLKKEDFGYLAELESR